MVITLNLMQMMWAADFDESMVYDLEEKRLEALMVQLPEDPEHEIREENEDTNDCSVRSGSQSNHYKNDSSPKAGLQNHGNTDNSIYEAKLKPLSSHVCGLTRNLWPRNDHNQQRIISSLPRKGNVELPIFCVAAILVINRQKIIRETHCFEEIIKAGAFLLHS